MRLRSPLVPVVAALLATSPLPALAGGPLPAQDQNINTSAYSVDLFQGPVLASSRVTGLAGAYAAIAEGVDGYSVNAAAPAVRQPWSIDHIDYDLSVGLTFPGGLNQTDFDNNGTVGFAYQDFLFVTLGANLQVGQWGFGFSMDAQQYHLQQELEVDGQRRFLSTSLGRTHVLLARALADGQLVVGAGVRGAYLNLNGAENPTGDGDTIDLFSMYGAGPEAGALWAPNGLPVRVGVGVRSSVKGEVQPDSRTTPNGEGDSVVEGRYLPETLVSPWEVEVGLALQFGRRPLNVAWTDPQAEKRKFVAQLEQARNERRGRRTANEAALERAEHERIKAARETIRAALDKRARSLPRQKLLVSAALLVSGPVQRGVGVESFLQQRVDRSGRDATITPRLGVEFEPVESRLQVRGGTYLEPGRFRPELRRLHGTLGFDLRLFDWAVFGLFQDDTTWRAGSFLDLSRDYFSWGASVGIWH